MGGMLINGCGAADSFYKIKDVGVFHCGKCGQNRVFSLMEVKLKIRIVWIPTVSINTKYAVACQVCNSGYYVDEQQKEDILYERAKVEVVSDGLLIQKKQEIVQEPSQPLEERPIQPTVEEKPVQPTVGQKPPEPPLADRRRFCGRCGGPLDSVTGNCPVCSPKEDILPTPQILKEGLNRKICPTCRLLYATNKTQCDICKGALVDRK